MNGYDRSLSEANQPTTKFQIGAKDFSSKFKIPEKLYGRDKEINEIIGDLKDNKSNRGTNLLLVGESGIGKSASLDEIHMRLRGEDRRN